MFNFSNQKTKRIVSSVIAIFLVLVMVLGCIVTTIGF